MDYPITGRFTVVAQWLGTWTFRLKIPKEYRVRADRLHVSVFSLDGAPVEHMVVSAKLTAHGLQLRFFGHGKYRVLVSI